MGVFSVAPRVRKVDAPLFRRPLLAAIPGHQRSGSCGPETQVGVALPGQARCEANSARPLGELETTLHHPNLDRDRVNLSILPPGRGIATSDPTEGNIHLWNEGMGDGVLKFEFEGKVRSAAATRPCDLNTLTKIGI